MSARATSPLARSSEAGSRSQSAAACRVSVMLSRVSAASARSTAPRKWLSSVTIATRTGARADRWALAGIVRLGIVEGGEIDLAAGLFDGEQFGVAARLAAHEERDLLQLALGLGGPRYIAI